MKQVNGQQKKVGEGLVCATLDVGDEQTSDGQIAREGAKLLERASQTGKPFFVAVGFHAPHLPLVAPKKYFELYDPAKIPLADEPLDALQAIPPTALVSSGTTERPLTPDERRQVIAAYYAMIAYLDAQAGLLLDALDRLKLTDNTLVIFTSDHGFHLGDHGGLWSKKTLFDAAVRVPLIIAGPGVVRGHSSPRLVELVDLFPTIAEMTATGTPPKLEGRSLSPLLSDPQAPRDRPARTKDPQELRNLAAEPSQAPAVKTMKAILHP
jgi:arylsulfatase A-like enzyme